MKEEIRDCFVSELEEIKKENDNVVVLVTDSTSTCRIAPLMKKYPEMIVNIGIAEQNMIGIAAGMSLGGLIPFTANATAFLFGRSNEQVKVDICYAETNVKLVGLNPGFAYGALGASHHCIDDVATAYSFGSIEVYAPSDPIETRQITRYAANKEGPIYIRLDSYKSEIIHDDNYIFEPGVNKVLKEGKDVTLIGLGTMIHEIMEAERELTSKGISVEVIGITSIRPLKKDSIIDSLKKTGVCFTFEEHSVYGGIGSIVTDIVVENSINCKVKKNGVPIGKFAPASPRESIKKKFGLDKKSIVDMVENYLKEL